MFFEIEQRLTYSAPSVCVKYMMNADMMPGFYLSPELQEGFHRIFLLFQHANNEYIKYYVSEETAQALTEYVAQKMLVSS